MPARRNEQDYQRRYYKKRRESLNATRKDAYEGDPAVRAQARERSRRARERNPKQYSDRVYYRDVKVAGVPRTIAVYPTGHIAKMIERTPQLIRSWEAKGWIPHPTFSGSHRLYTSHQVALLVNLSAALVKGRGRRSSEPVIEAIDRAHAEWNMIPTE